MTTQTFTLPAGTYIIGDVCYSITNDDVYQPMVDDLCDTEAGMVNVPGVEVDEDDEKYYDEDGNTNDLYDQAWDKYEEGQGQIFTFNTHADGVYNLDKVDGSFVQELTSDAANISIIPVEVVDSELQKEEGYKVTFEKEFTVEVIDGNKVVINNQYVINF